MAQYGGVYRAVIISTNDPGDGGRVQVRLPAMPAGGMWAEVCTPFGAPPNTMPAIGGTVIVAFEMGDINRPIVLGSVPN
jgi:uncharacterized protein involved in type VI secretion and phage assembly